jgi:hypothetical protein
MEVQDYKDQNPKLDVSQFFNGPMDAWGLVQDRSGAVTERFYVKMEGRWTNNEGELQEDFVYSDGRKQQRIWKLKKTSDSDFEGTASDIKGIAKGKVAGPAVRWNYVMKLDYRGSTYEVTFDDWMFLINDDVMINRAYMKKFGIKVAEISLVMKKIKP